MAIDTGALGKVTSALVDILSNVEQYTVQAKQNRR